MIIYDESYQDYAERPAIRQSTLKSGRKSMKQLRHDIDNPRRLDSSSVLVGSGAHRLLEVGPAGFDDIYAVMPSFHLSRDNVDAKGTPSNSKNTTWYRMASSEWESQQAGKEIVDQSQYDQIRGIIKALHADPISSRLIAAAKFEVTLTWDWQGIPCKARIDMLGDGWWADLKTTDSVELYAFGRKFANLGYDFQCGFYSMGMAANGMLDWECKLITVENESPHDVAVVPVHESHLDEFRPRVERVLSRYKECLETGEWPGVANGQEYELHVPNWSMPEDDCELI